MSHLLLDLHQVVDPHCHPLPFLTVDHLCLLLVSHLKDQDQANGTGGAIIVRGRYVVRDDHCFLLFYSCIKLRERNLHCFSFKKTTEGTNAKTVRTSISALVVMDRPCISIRSRVSEHEERRNDQGAPKLLGTNDKCSHHSLCMYELIGLLLPKKI